MTHPIGRSRQRRINLGCFGFVVMFGIILGIGSFIYFNLIDTEDSSNDTPSGDVVDNNVDDSDTRIGDTTNPEFAEPIERHIYFPNAETAGTIVEAYRKPGGWEVGHLQQLVGHLEGTPWLGEDGNMVLAGHFEDELGRPGPFRYLYFAEIGDRILLQEGNGPMHVYVVSDVFRTDPTDIEVLRKSDNPKLTLITCDSWSYDTATYEQRLVVVAEPVGTLDNGQIDTATSDS